MNIEMFSKHETIIFGAAMVAFVLASLILYFALDGAARLIQARNERYLNERHVDRRYRIERNEFEELGNAAIRNQRMKSFITETSTGRVIEFTVDEILQEVKERKKNG